MDIDLHGPNTLKMLGMDGRKMEVLENQINPLQYKDNLKVVSISSFLDGPETAVIWRGPLKIGVIKQFIGDVTWGDLDYLVIDSPPGTGDEPLTVAQSFKGAESIIITTPQEVSLLDVSKSVTFCRQVNMPVIGIVENMSGFACPHCGKEINIFPKGGAENLAKKSKLPFLGTIPMQPDIAAASDSGRPFAGNDGEQPEIGKRFEKIVDTIIQA
jgi:Mrp family chromosome partitioning ATPase